jgi:hypothetical protein
MADTIEMQDIRGLDIDKAVKGFALTEYIFKNDCTISSMSGDAVRWYQETAADLTATAPSYVENISPLSSFPNLEVSWTRNTSYVKKFAAEGFLSMEDMKSADIDVLARTLLRLTRAVTKKVDSAIWDVMTENRIVVNINTNATNAPWNTASFTGVDIIEDLMEAKMNISNQGYNPEGASLYLSPLDYKQMVTWLISSKGSSIPQFASDKVSSGTVMQILGLNVKVSLNVTADYAAVVIPKVACTWKSFTDITSRVIEEAGIGSKVRVWELGIPILTDPKAVNLITNTQT